MLPELDTPPANGVFVDWEEEREVEVILFDEAADDPDEGNRMGETIDVHDDWDNGLP